MFLSNFVKFPQVFPSDELFTARTGYMQKFEGDAAVNAACIPLTQYRNTAVQYL